MPGPSVEADGLAKAFGPVEALKPVSFSVEEGEVFGVIGPDGAGKTTLFRLLVTLLLPDAGRARVDGLHVVDDYREVRRRVGYMPGRFSLYPDLSVAENLRFFASIFGTTVAANRDLIDGLYRHLEPFADRRAAALSGGMKQKLALCCALVHRPRVLFLDEPTTGVDAVSRVELWEMLGRLRGEGISVVVSTPYMDEAERCDRVALMDGGRFLATASPAELAAGYGRPLYEIPVPGGRRLELLRALREGTADEEAAGEEAAGEGAGDEASGDAVAIAAVHLFGDTVHVTLDGGRVPGDGRSGLEHHLAGRGFGDLPVRPVEAGIEDVFMALAGGEPGGDGARDGAGHG